MSAPLSQNDARATELRLALPDSVLEAVAERAAELVLERFETPLPGASEFLTVAEAAELLRAKPQRVYDLLSDGRLERFKDGSRVLVRRADVVAHVTHWIAKPYGKGGCAVSDEQRIRGAGALEKARAGGPAKGRGRGGPARGYKWEQFKPGHELSLRHGAYSSALRLAPRAEEIAARLREAMGEAFEDKFTAAIEAGALAGAIALTQAYSLSSFLVRSLSLTRNLSLLMSVALVAALTLTPIRGDSVIEVSELGDVLEALSESDTRWPHLQG